MVAKNSLLVVQCADDAHKRTRNLRCARWNCTWRKRKAAFQSNAGGGATYLNNLAYCVRPVVIGAICALPPWDATASRQQQERTRAAMGERTFINESLHNKPNEHNKNGYGIRGFWRNGTI